MTKTVDSEPPKTVSGLTHIQRWEDDGGAVSEGGHPISNVAEKNNPRSMSGAKNDLLHGEQNNTHSKGDKQMNPFISFMASTAGRNVRIVAGFALLLWGRLGLSGMTALIVALIGVVPLFAGTLDFCVLGPLFGAPLSGSKIRAVKTT